VRGEPVEETRMLDEARRGERRSEIQRQAVVGESRSM